MTFLHLSILGPIRRQFKGRCCGVGWYMRGRYVTFGKKLCSRFTNRICARSMPQCNVGHVVSCVPDQEYTKKHTTNMPNIYKKYTKNISQIHQTYTKIYPRCVRDKYKIPRPARPGPSPEPRFDICWHIVSVSLIY